MNRQLPLPVLQWLTVLATGALVALLVASVVGQQSAAEERARQACEGARDTRQVLVDMLEFTGSQQLDPDDYTGDLRDAVQRSIEQGERFRDATVRKLRIPPPQCEGVAAP